MLGPRSASGVADVIDGLESDGDALSAAAQACRPGGGDAGGDPAGGPGGAAIPARSLHSWHLLTGPACPPPSMQNMQIENSGSSHRPVAAK